MLAGSGNFVESNGNFLTVLVNSAEISVRIEIADNRMAGQSNGFVHGRQTEQPLQVIGQRRRFGEKIFKRRFLENFGFARTGRAVVQVIVKTSEIEVVVRFI